PARPVVDIERLADVPALSPVMAQLSATLGREDVSVMHIEAIIRRDPVIAARIVSAANAAAWATPAPVTSIRAALMRLGLVRVRRLTMLLSLYGSMPAPVALQRAFWRHSLAVAHLAEAVARSAPAAAAQADVAFMAGLTHDLGLLALAAHHPRETA